MIDKRAKKWYNLTDKNISIVFIRYRGTIPTGSDMTKLIMPGAIPTALSKFYGKGDHPS